MKTRTILNPLFAIIAVASAALAQTPTPGPTATPSAPTPTPVSTTVQVILDATDTAKLSQAAPATTGTMIIAMDGSMITITPTGACTFNATGTSRVGKLVTFVITTAGASSFVLTWGTNFKATGTLATGATAGKKFAVTFRCLDGTTWIEVARTAAM
jgi:hypothetical protein